ncbi:MAG: hypothetical protein HY978_04145 [Candidatus Liptonbacteria bacterium]|nr:hypothetical protein [Candidatus Liptonbacteria bacterium]
MGASNFALGYLVGRFLGHILGFFRHWCVGGTRAILYRLVEILRTINSSFAVWITLRHLTEPLYQDYSIVGRILGPVFRAGRLLIGFLLSLIAIIVFLPILLIWEAIPPFILLYALGVIFR